MKVGVPNLAHRTGVLWGLFDDSDVMGKIILQELEQVISHHTQGKGLPIHNHEALGNHIIGIESL